ncbi:hypothetical protein [Actinokineospora sp. NBRC 105648]|uniref:hypothetical protein n=1 Tax=Actinokineospora sp. NBRC 105648 TaxID=3032206 RepID=UPI0024A1B047|nr:hypothetical protein [Actinokineospora sp. NBRC 105648]GLZ42511.1 hypothetical protein Acsp05_61350 [Actinokineospora sp. NBRC 105648]
MSTTSGSEVAPGRDTTRPGAAPRRADGIELIGEMRGSGYRRPPALVRRVDGQVVQLTPLLYAVLAAVDGEADHDEIAARVRAATGRGVTAADVDLLIQAKLTPLGVLRLPDGSEPTPRKATPLLGLRMRHVISDPDRTRRITAPFARLFNPVLVVATLAAFAAVSFWVLFHKGLAGATRQVFEQPPLLLLVIGVTIVSAGFHEFGHAAAARRGGATPGAMGFGLYLMWPTFYTDVTDSYRLGRAGRLRTDLGGLYFNTLVAVGMFGLWWVSGWDALLLVIATQILQMVRQLAPMVRFDGYHVLADLTGVPDLYQHIKPTLLGLLPNRWRTPSNLKPWARVVVTLWVVVVVPLLLLSTATIVLTLPRVLGTAWAGMGRQWQAATTDYADGDIAGVLVRALAILAVGLSIVGVGLMLARSVRRLVTRTWKRTEGKPLRRALAGLTAAAVLIALAWAWWPAPDRYRPIQPDERGTVVDILHAVQTKRLPAASSSAPTVTTKTVWPQSAARPTKERPTLAMVLVPVARQGGPAPTAPTWVFPFDRPDPPGPGDNQALAVNTTHGSVRYEVSFALVWVTDGESTNRNEAWALASCRDCTTVAIAFQVVLIVGQADVVVPENIAVAINHSCVECVTYALASQLVITLPGDLSPGAKARLDEIWARLADLAQNIQGMSAQQIQDALQQVKVDILTVVSQEGGTTPTPSTAPTTSGSTAPTTTVTAPSVSGTSSPATTTTSQSAVTTTTTPSRTTASASSTPNSTTTPPSPTTTQAPLTSPPT